ncbi:alpha/beta fold hydrolase [Janthinobacterium psychrotolerans]|uniref:Triacylglycerol esterase/lipase EstA, alpha/beta hydrolase fold n=1 Tax=Janthinobacterium psychrotolerans TaxID=1747903 RepID=A0A1A7C523_9BURK|nr:alpha/beta fold hydrolase [Janthinobacterium psychrotolerans]OBV40139.1 Triacylglycerol esterase/lipase EstA, alpha/beta hydrolase fold [Janthinobacterium psychrotolerans]
MIARALRWLMLLQVLAALGLAWLLWQGGLRHMALALLLGAMGVLLVRALIVARNFWHSRRDGGQAVPQPLGMAAAARLFMGELSANLRTSSWGMLRPRLSKPGTPGKALLPVLLIHGYVCNRGFWAPLSGQLARAGVVHGAVDLEPVNAGIEDFVPVVEQAIDALLADAGARQVIIVAHSMGGLVARAYLRRHGCARVARVITIGTPHHGTALANLAVGSNARQMSRPGGRPGAWLAQLDHDETPQARALITSIYSHHDNIVAPQDSARLPGARNHAYAGLGHVALASDARVLRQVLAEITIVSQVGAAVLASG